MCILIHHLPETNFEFGHIQDFYSKNSDGFGATVKKPDGTVKIIKTVGKLDEVYEMYVNEVKGYEAIIHFRMKTHGDIDLINCHPYQVTDNLWMAHNGILSTGNTADTTKSDTWHYIQNFLKPLLERDHNLIHQPAFQKLIESHIGYSNKFGFMDNEGRVVILNRNSGVEHFGAWLSNTYAWSPSKWGYYTASYGNQYASAWDPQDRLDFGSSYNWSKQDGWTKTKPLTRKEKKASRKKTKETGALAKPVSQPDRLSTEALGVIIRSCYNAIQRNAEAGVTDWVIMHPMKAMNLIWEFYPQMYSKAEISDIVNSDPDEAAAIIEAIWYECEEDMMALAQLPFTPKLNGGIYESYDL